MNRVALAIVLSSLGGGGQRIVRQCQTSYGYQQAQVVTYAQPVQAYYAPYGVQTQFVAVEQAYDPYYASLVGSSVRSERAQLGAANLANQVATLSATVAQLSQVISKGGLPVVPPINPPPVMNPQPPNPPNPPVVVAPDPNTPPPPPVPAGTAPAEVVSLLQTKCAKCHTTGGAKKDAIALFEADGKTLVKFTPATLLMIDQAVFSGDMPRNSQPLSAPEYTLIRNWINDSKDEITASLKELNKGSK